MSAAYESLSLIEAADIIEETPAPPRSGVKVLHMLSETRQIAADRDRAFRALSDARRHRRRHPVDPDGGIAQDRASIEPPQAKEVARKQALGLLDRALESIDLGRRAVLVLHEIEQMTAPEIAKTLDLPLNTVYSRLRVARTELETEIKRLAGGER